MTCLNLGAITVKCHVAYGINLGATWPMSKPMCHVSYIGVMWRRFKWVPHGRMQLVTNIVTILVARSLMYTIYGGHICIQRKNTSFIAHDWFSHATCHLLLQPI